MRRYLPDAALVLLIIAGSVMTLPPNLSDLIFVSPWDGFGSILPHTAWAALKVWVFWASGALVIGGLVLRLEPRLGLVDAAIAGLVGVWILAWIGGNLLGPIRLFRGPTAWALIALGAVWLWRTPPAVTIPPVSAGQRLALLTAVLVLPILLLVQLGNVAPPFMDVFATPAAAQRIVTFGVYLPLDNDPYGYWNPSSQLPGLELFHALLALGSHSLAVIAGTAAIVPLGTLLILATYRLGATIAGDVAGGFAALLLCATTAFRTLPYGHGRFVTFALVGAGLAFVLDRRRNPTRLALGALALGTAVPTHAIIGTFGMATAAFGLLIGGPANVLAGLGLLGGATLVALPTVAVGLQVPVPYPLPSLVQLVGVAAIVVAARRLRPRTTDRLRWLRWAFALAAIYAVLWHPYPVFLNNHVARFPLLVWGGGLGLAAMLLMDWRPPRPLLGPVIFALLFGMTVEYLSARYHGTFSDPGVRVAMHNWFWKVDYWFPYVLTLPTACLAAWLSRTVSPRLTVLLVLAILIVPWRDHLDPAYAPAEGRTSDPNYHQISITELWAYEMETGKRGHWGSMKDRRWAQSPAELALADVLREEVAAGRITPETHVVHLSAFISLYQDVLLFSVYTGVNDDPYLTDHVFNPSDAGSRLRPIEEIHARLAERPPYVAIHGEPSVRLAPDALAGYEEIFNQDGIRLLREESVR